MWKLAIALGALVLPAHALAQVSSNQAEATVLRIDPVAASRISDEERSARTFPYIALYEIRPPVTTFCNGAGPCFPTAYFFLYNPAKFGQTATVRCTAFDKNKAAVALASEEPQLRPGQRTDSGVLFENADFTKFDSVECRIVKTVPNNLARTR
jgi:hypothetical protein